MWSFHSHKPGATGSFTLTSTATDSTTGQTGQGTASFMTSGVAATIVPVSRGALVETGSPAFGKATTAGNLLLAYVVSNGSSATFPITVTGTGWTLAKSGGGAYFWMSIWYKKNCGASETPPTFNGQGSDTWSALAEFSGADTSAPFDKGAVSATEATSWTAAFTAPDSVPGELIAGVSYFIGPDTKGETITLTQFKDSTGGTMAGTLSQAKNTTWGQSFGTVDGVAGNTGSYAHIVGMSVPGPNTGGGVIAAFKPASSQPSALSISTSSLPAGVTTQAYTATLTASGGTPPYTWSVSSDTLPGGLILAANGIISGTPTTAGTSNFAIKVTDNASNTATAALAITINSSPPVVFTSSAAQADWTAPAPDSQFVGGAVNPHVSQNVWNPITGWNQTLTVYSPRQWFVVANMPTGNTAVVSFPDTGIYFNLTSQPWFTTFTSGFTETMDTDPAIIASACYDLWFWDAAHTDQWHYEIMIHHDFRNRGEAAWYAAGVPFGGYTVDGTVIPANTWNLAYQAGDTAAFWNLGTSSSLYNMSSGAVDIAAMINYLVSHSILPSSPQISAWSYGFEICSTGAANHTFFVNNCGTNAHS